MFSFFKHKKTDLEVPDWANYFNASDYSKFAGHINNYFALKNISCSFGDEEIELEHEKWGVAKLGLVNLAQMCHQSKRRKWKMLIYGHFLSLEKNWLFTEDFDKKVHDFSLAKDYLGVRLYHNDYVSVLEDGLVIGKQLTDDIFALLVFDFPQSVVNVKPEQTIQWNKTNEELFDIGVINIKTKYKYNPSLQKFGKFKAWIVHGTHFFVPNVVLDLPNYPNLIGSKGSLVGIPHRHSVLIYPINDLMVVDAINLLIPIICEMNKKGPGSISNNLFWYNGNEFFTLPYSLDDQKLQFYPPKDFELLLNSLPS